MAKEGIERYSAQLYLVFRVLIGLLFLGHGAMKISGLTAGTTSVFSLMGFACVIEVLGGILIVLGIYTRYVAILTAFEMLVAFFMVHFPKGWNPLSNGGEPAVLFFAAFLALIALGSGRLSLDTRMNR